MHSEHLMAEIAAGQGDKPDQSRAANPVRSTGQIRHLIVLAAVDHARRERAGGGAGEVGSGPPRGQVDHHPRRHSPLRGSANASADRRAGPDAPHAQRPATGERPCRPGTRGAWI